MRNRNCFVWLKSSLIFISGLLLAACAANGSMHRDNPHGQGVSSSACAGNAYLQKYGCSMRRIENAARSGDPDAQYALGYMYYYGIGTAKDKQSAQTWISRAARQGQPLAKRAENLMNGGQSLHSLHPRAESQYNAARGQGGDSSYRSDSARRATQYTPTPSVDELNTATPDKPLNQVLPNYGNKPKSQQSGKSESVIKSLRRKGSSPATDSTPDNSKTPVEPITRLHDPRLSPNAKPNSGYAKKIASHRDARGSMTAVENQMMMTPKQHFTLQLMSGRNLSAIKLFMREHNLEGRAHYYSAQRSGRPWYMLVYGNYPSVEMARMAAQQLPPSLQSMHPWVKSYRVVQDEIRLRRIVT